jgi:hypothetical protein
VILTATVRTLAGALLHEGEDTRVLGPQTYWDYCETRAASSSATGSRLTRSRPRETASPRPDKAPRAGGRSP